jgi:hypothetical protein
MGPGLHGWIDHYNDLYHLVKHEAWSPPPQNHFARGMFLISNPLLGAEDLTASCTMSAHAGHIPWHIHLHTRSNIRLVCIRDGDLSHHLVESTQCRGMDEGEAIHGPEDEYRLCRFHDCSPAILGSGNLRELRVF